MRELSGAAAHLQAGVERLSQVTVPIANWIPERLRGKIAFDRDATRTFIAERMQTWGTVRRQQHADGRRRRGRRDGADGARRVHAVLPVSRRRAHAAAVYEHGAARAQPVQEIVMRTQEVIAATIYGVLVIAAIQGTLGTFIFWVLGLPSPLLWGVVMFFLSMIPMAGAFLVWVPAAIYLALTGAFLQGRHPRRLGPAGDRHRSTTSCRRDSSAIALACTSS